MAARSCRCCWDLPSPADLRPHCWQEPPAGGLLGLPQPQSCFALSSPQTCLMGNSRPPCSALLAPGCGGYTGVSPSPIPLPACLPQVWVARASVIKSHLRGSRPMAGQEGSMAASLCGFPTRGRPPSTATMRAWH